jgi:hypothetical protein
VQKLSVQAIKRFFQRGKPLFLFRLFDYLATKYLVTRHHFHHMLPGVELQSSQFRAFVFYRDHLASLVSRALPLTIDETIVHPSLIGSKRLVVTVAAGTSEAPKIHGLDFNQDSGWDRILISDNSQILNSGWPFWKVVSLTELTSKKGRAAAREIKTSLDLLFPEYDQVLWIDASVFVPSNSLLRVASQLSESPLVASAHHRNATLRDELDDLLVSGKVSSKALVEIRDSLEENEGEASVFPETPVILVNNSVAGAAELMSEWRTQLLRFENRDQPALAVASGTTGVDLSSWFSSRQTHSHNNSLFVVLGHSSDGLSEIETVLIKMLLSKEPEPIKAEISELQPNANLYCENSLRAFKVSFATNSFFVLLHDSLDTKMSLESTKQLLLSATDHPGRHVSPMENCDMSLRFPPGNPLGASPEFLHPSSVSIFDLVASFLRPGCISLDSLRPKTANVWALASRMEGPPLMTGASPQHSCSVARDVVCLSALSLDRRLRWPCLKTSVAFERASSAQRGWLRMISFVFSALPFQKEATFSNVHVTFKDLP